MSSQLPQLICCCWWHLPNKTMLMTFLWRKHNSNMKLWILIRTFSFIWLKLCLNWVSSMSNKRINIILTARQEYFSFVSAIYFFVGRIFAKIKLSMNKNSLFLQFNKHICCDVRINCAVNMCFFQKIEWKILPFNIY